MSEVPETAVKSIAAAPDGTVWLGHLLGLTCISPDETITFYPGRLIRDYPYFTRTSSSLAHLLQCAQLYFFRCVLVHNDKK